MAFGHCPQAPSMNLLSQTVPGPGGNAEGADNGN